MKSYSLLMALAVLALAVSGCGGSTAPVPKANPVAPPAAAPTEKATETMTP